MAHGRRKRHRLATKLGGYVISGAWEGNSVCGIVGIASTSSVNQQVYDALGLLQHRGQDSTGIATLDGPHVHIRKGKGMVKEAFRTRDMRSLVGNVGLGHVRYATKGEADNELEAQPFYEIGRAHV